MTALPNNDRQVQLAPTAGVTALPFDFWIARAEDLSVWRVRAGVSAKLVLGTDYTVTGAGSDAGGTVTLAAGALAGDAYAIVGDWQVKQVLDLVAVGDFFANDVDHQHRLILAGLMELRRDLGRTLSTPVADASQPYDAASRALKGLTYLELDEQASVAAPGADKLRIYAKDVSGSTRVFVRTATAEIDIVGNADAALAAANSANAAATAAAASAASAASNAADALAAAELLGEAVDTIGNDYPSRAAVALAQVPLVQIFLRTAGYAAAGDRGGALYKRVGSAPAHKACIEDALGNWWEIAEDVVTPYMLGAKPDGGTYTTQLQDWLDVVRLWTEGAQEAPELHLPGGTWITGARLVYGAYTEITGNGIFSSVLKLANGANDHVLVDYAWQSQSVGTSYAVLFRNFSIDGNKANQTATDIDGLVYMGFMSNIEECCFTNCKRHGAHASTVHRDGTEDTQTLVDTLWRRNRYVGNGGAGWYGETGVTNLKLADQKFEDEIFAGNGSWEFAQLHAMRSAGFELINCRTYSGNARDDVFLNLFGRGTIIGGNYELQATGILGSGPTAVADAAAIRIVPAGQNYINVVGVQVMTGDSLVDNGVTRYNGIFINGSSNFVNIAGCNASTNGTIANGRALRISGTVAGICDLVEEGFPTASQYSNLQTRDFQPTRFQIGARNDVPALGSSAFRQHGTGFAGAAKGLARWSNDTDGGYDVFFKSRSATIGTPGIVANGDRLGERQWRGDNGVNSAAAANLAAYVDGAPSSTSMPGRLVVGTTPAGATAPTLRWQWSSAGNLQPQADNSYSLGTASFRASAIYAANGTIQTSDARAKTDVENASLGLDFVMQLRPVSYRWKEGGRRVVRQVYLDRDGNEIPEGAEIPPDAMPGRQIVESVDGRRRHWGFLAQEVKAAVDACGGPDFGGWVIEDTGDPDSRQSLRYDQLIAPLVRALQELATKVAMLEARQ